MSVGEIALYRDTNNSQTSPSVEGTWEGVEFNNQERQDASYTQNVNDIDVNIADTGKYLCIYTIRATCSGARHTLRGRMLLNGSVVESGYGYGHGRGFPGGEPHNQVYVMGHAILDVTAGEDVRIEWTNDGISGTDTTSRSKSSLMLVRLTDDDDVAYARYTDGTDVASYGGTAWTDVPWDTVEEETNIKIIQRQSGNVAIKLKKATRYLIAYSFMIGGPTRSQRVVRATLDGTPIKQSYSYTYSRNTATDFDCCVAMFVVDSAVINQILIIQAQRGDAAVDGTKARIVNSSGLDIMELPADAHTIITHDDTGGQNVNPSTFVAANWARNEDQRNSASFALPSITEVQVEEAGNYLFMANGRSNRVPLGSDGERTTQEGNWFVDGAEHDLGNHGCYIRGQHVSTVAGTFNGSFNAAVIFSELNISNSIDFRMQNDGGTGSLNDDTIPNECGFSALNLNRLIPGEFISGDPIQPDVVVVLTSGSSWTVPANFDNQRNFIEIIGGGGGGASGDFGEGGGGAGYNRINDFDTEGSASIPFQLGQSGSAGIGGGGASSTDGTPTIWHLGGQFEIAAGGGSGSLTGSIVGGGSGLFDGGRGGVSDVFAGAGGGGGAGSASGSGDIGLPGAIPGGGAGGDGGCCRGGSGGTPNGGDGGTGSVWIDTTTGEIAGPGGGGGGGTREADQIGGAAGAYGAGGGGGSTADQPAGRKDGGPGTPGSIVITYRSTLHALTGQMDDNDRTEMRALNLLLRSSIIDSDKTLGQLLRRVILGPTQAGNAVMIDEEILDAPVSFQFAYTAALIDVEMSEGVPIFEFRFTEKLIDSDTTDTRFHTIKRVNGTILDVDQTKAVLNLIHGLDNSIIIDGDGADSEGIITGIIELSGVVGDREGIAHLITPPRDIAFFINRDPRPFSGSAVIDKEFTYPTSLHGFHLLIYELNGMPVEPTLVTFRPQDDLRTKIILTEVQMITLGL